jgi:hypothetical protein
MEEEPQKRGMEYPILILCLIGALVAFVIAAAVGK